MKYTKVILLVSFVTLIFVSCKKESCNCQQSWVNDCNLIYYDGDQVEHNGICYKAYTQGRACSVEPGTSKGDIWDVCTNK